MTAINQYPFATSAAGLKFLASKNNQTVQATYQLVEDAIRAAIATDGTHGDITVSSGNWWLNTVISPEQFGAVSGGSADCKAALVLALATGRTVDGAGQTYGVSGKLSLITGSRLQNLTLKQLAPAASQSVITLEASSVNNIYLKSVKVDRNGNGANSGTNTAPNGPIATAFGVRINGGTGHHIEDLEVTGNDSGTIIQLADLDGTSKIIRPYVHDVFSVVHSATDDTVQGITLIRCTDLIIESPRVERIGWKDLIGDAVSYANCRAITCSGGKYVRLLNPTVDYSGQGIDFSGDTGSGNIGCSIEYPVVKNCGTWGVKVANISKRTHVIGGKSYNCGSAGFVDSNSWEIVEYDAQAANFTIGSTVTGGTSGATGVIAEMRDRGATGWLSLTGWNQVAFIDNEAITSSGGGAAVVNLPAGMVSDAMTELDANKFIDCESWNCGDGTAGTSGGLLKLQGIRNMAAPVKFIRCTAKDERATPTMHFGFFNEVPDNILGWFEAIDCKSYGATSNDFRGLNVRETNWHWQRLVASRNLTSTTADQPVFASTMDEITLDAYSIYEFESDLYIASMAASGNFGFSLSGTAAITGFYTSVAAKLAAVTPSALHTPEHLCSNTYGNRALVTASANTTGYARLCGTIATTTGGTIIPNISLGTAAVAAMLAGTFFRVRKIASNSGNNGDNTHAGAVS